MNPSDALPLVLIEEILRHPDAPDHWHQPARNTPLTPAVTMSMTYGVNRYELLSVLAHFGARQHVTIEELSVETFYPADGTTRLKLVELASWETGSGGSRFLNAT
ncbi:MAG: hypothetical protein QF921_01540 [Pseudomonadales bacterium]|jgi:hypothetical protein|nr:hypothetical protein [Pseudomonadales bacterium]MDP6470999.1 hypothetical protein [Pseudomonadales bacterium]MDP6825816.1 hypothetical protein [Pseudomonadales bacterium]MDP6970191.1 hypothetical protein [Pseudomonadales bacterium]|tara:strand:+ start:203 stop:517 length:315 start_codon:yes stop_codon:yes gene_type:complete